MNYDETAFGRLDARSRLSICSNQITYSELYKMEHSVQFKTPNAILHLCIPENDSDVT